MVLLRRRHVLRDAAAEQVGAGLDGERRQRVEGRGLLRRRGRREQRLGVRGEVRGAVRRVETFRQHDQGGTRARGFEHFGPRAREVEGFVGACRGKGERGDMLGLGVKGGVWEGLPVASWMRASFRGFFRRPAIAAFRDLVGGVSIYRGGIPPLGFVCGIPLLL